jgi:carbonic anhydrase
MRKLLFVMFVLVNILLVLSMVSGQDATPPHWTYEGEEGPEHWGSLDDSYALCSNGRAQSPIDIADAQGADLADITFNYQTSMLNIVNNGHTIQVNYDEGSSIVYNEIEYQLVQFHFHHPSEHTLNGEAFDLELHFVHRDANGALAVVGVMLREGEADNTAFAPVFDNLPQTPDDPPPTDSFLNGADLLPAEHRYFTYTGSLTTPPCTQGVRWLVLQTPVEISAAQIEAFAALFELNARPVQPLNTRDLLDDSTAGA